MTYLRSMSLGTKLNLALLAFLLLLGAATSAIMLYGFSRTRDNATERSREALEEQGELALQAVASGASEAGGLQFEAVAEIGRRSARYMESAHRSGADAGYVAPPLARTEAGLYYDPDPDRTSDLVILNGESPGDPNVQDDIAFAAALDTIFPVLYEGFAGEVGGQNLDPIAIVFISTNSASRYYPPVGIHQVLPPEVDISRRMDMIGPTDNPQRLTLWTAPYEDAAGQGQIVTARTPVYDGETFRGSLEVDLSTDKLIDQINIIRPTPGGFAFYVDSAGTLWESDAFALLSAEAAQSPELSAVLDSMRANQGDFNVVVEKLNLGQEEFFVAYAPMLTLGGSFAVAAPVSEVTDRAAAITAGIDDEGTRTFRVMLAAMGALFVAGLLGATYLNRQAVLRPIAELVGATRAVAAGDLSANVPVARGDELGQLGESFNTMVEQLRESERALEQRVEARTRELQALLEMSKALSSTLELEPLLDDILDHLKSLVDCAGAAVLLLQGDQLVQLAVRRPASAGPMNPTPIGSPARSYTIIWDSIERGEAVMIDDVRGDSPLARAYRAQVPVDLELTPLAYIRAWAAVPLIARDKVIGMLAMAHEAPDGFDERDVELAAAVAAQAAVAIENARLYAEAQQAASLEERQRLARELHDSVSQALYGIVLGAGTARLRIDENPRNAAEPIEYVMSLAQAGLAEMRALIFELRPESLEQEGLVAAIEKQVASARARHSIAIDFEPVDEPDCRLDVKEALYRIAQEALQNVVKHAQAQHVEVRLEQGGGDLVLTISDDGRGFDASGSFPGHVGLHSMAERAAKLGGAVVIESEPGSGARVIARVPA